MRRTTISTKEYEGWRNRETWLGHLWLNNDDELYELFHQAIRETDGIHTAAHYLDEVLHEQMYHELGASSMWQDLLGTAFDRIDWVEIVTNNIEDFKED